jgi:ribosomal protein L4
VIEAGTLNTYDVLKYDALVLSTGALELVTQRLTD